jgi:hypothetical protein
VRCAIAGANFQPIGNLLNDRLFFFFFPTFGLGAFE